MTRSCCRGEIWTVDLGAGSRSEQHGLRPVLIIQDDVGNRFASTTIVAVITSTIRPYPVTVLLRQKEGGLVKPSMVNLAQIFTVDKSRLRKRIGRLSRQRLAEVDTAIRVSLAADGSRR